MPDYESLIENSDFDVHRCMNVAREICIEIGKKENPPYVWNVNMPGSLMMFVVDKVVKGLRENPDYDASCFDFDAVYKRNLRFTD